MLRTILYSAFSFLLLFSSFAFSAELTSKVRSALGDVSRQKKNQNNWGILRVGSKVYESDKLKTGEESEIVLGLPDGSLITVAEKSEIIVSVLFEKNSQQTSIGISSGKIGFVAQKQKNKDASFSFKTGTAVAAIRGTEGVISDESSIFSLSSGKLEISSGANTYAINGGETSINNDEGKSVVIQLASSGNLDFISELETILADSTTNFETRLAQIKQADSLFQKKLKQVQNMISCSFESFPDSTYLPKLSLKGKCALKEEYRAEHQISSLEIFGEQVFPAEDGTFSKDIEFEPDAFGEKQFKVFCVVDDSLSIYAQSFKTLYLQMPEKPKEISSFILQTEKSVNICKKPLEIEGSYTTEDKNATLTVQIGNVLKSENLIRLSDGQKHSFIYKTNLTDVNNLWNETKALVIFNAKDYAETKEITLNVDKTCREVNQIKPALRFNSYDSLKCKVNLYASNLESDAAIFKIYKDGSEQKEDAILKNSYLNTSLAKGIHEYEFELMDQAENKSVVKKTLGCFPQKNFSLLLFGNTYEKLRVPPPPNGMVDKITKTLDFKIKTVENDPSYIHSVVVKQNGKEILREVKDQIQSLDFSLPVELKRNFKNQFDIQVIHKNGIKKSAKKIYEVR